ncbi:hypothetical protein SEA_OLINDD_106 [Microbacterium phage OlinDD]|nr:hypothetical protein SEA_OLINDD_106 [Microbacterium phage OlinDD]
MDRGAGGAAVSSGIDRRKVLAWSVPVIAMAVATPLAAASAEPVVEANRIKFTNVTATEGPKPNVIYANTRVQVVDGPASVKGVTLVVSISTGSSVTRTFPLIGGWGSTDQQYFEFEGVPKGEPVTVTFTAVASGVKSIVGQVKVVTPSWWN